MKKISLNVKIIIPIVAVLILSVSVMSVMSYMSIKDTVYMIINNEIGTAINNIEEQISANDATVNIVMEQMDKKNLALARALSEMIRLDKRMIEETEMTRLATLLDVTEVHVTDENGILLWGNTPGYFGFDFASGDQSRPFLKILEDPSYELAQEPQPNTILGSLFQYTGVTRYDQTGFVQVGLGMEVIDEIKSELSMARFVKNQRVGNDGFPFIIDNGVITFHPNADYVGRDVSGEAWYMSISSGEGRENIEIDGIKYYAGYKNINNNQQILAVLTESEINSHTGEVRNSSIIISAAAVVFMSVVIIIMMSGIITRPIQNMSRKLKAVTQGELDVEINVKSNDELGHLAYDFNSLRQMIQKLVLDVDTMNYEHSRNKNYGYMIDGTEYFGGFKEIADIINSMADFRAKESMTLRTAVENLNDITQTLDLHIKSNAASASDARDIAEKTKGFADLGGEKMGVMLKAIEDINESSNNLAKVIKAIDSIALQTNMLAINAGIEAVKAGEFGRSFSVLAEQISVLAKKSAGSVDESALLLETAKNNTDAGTDITNETVGVIQKMIEQIIIVSERINNIAQASREQEREINNLRETVMKIQQIMA